MAQFDDTFGTQFDHHLALPNQDDPTDNSKTIRQSGPETMNSQPNEYLGRPLKTMDTATPRICRGLSRTKCIRLFSEVCIPQLAGNMRLQTQECNPNMLWL